MAGTTRVTVVIKLLFGPQGRVVFHVPSTVVSPTDPIVLAVVAIIEAWTHGKALQIEISLQAAIAGSPVAGAAYVSEDKGLFRFRDVNGVSHAYKVAGLLASVVDTDKEGIKTGVVPGSTYVGAVTTNAKTRANEALASFISAHRTENRKPIKAGTA